jgi:hypothetical protein
MRDPSLLVEPTTLSWRPGPTCRVDVCVFRRERQLALEALSAGDHDATAEPANRAASPRGSS